MHSKKIVSLLVLVLLVMAVGCGVKPLTSPGLIGEKLEDLTGIYNAYGIQADVLYLVDKPTQRIHAVDVAAMSLKNSYAISKPENHHTLASSLDGSYVVDFSDKHLEVIRADGTRTSKPFAFQGTPVSAAFNPLSGILVMQDDLQSIGLMLLSDQGEISKSWLGGSLLGEDKALLAGDVDRDGRLVLAVSDMSLLTVDIEKSIDEEQWEFTSFDTGLNEISWVAPNNDEENPDLLLVVADNHIAVLNTQTKTVVSQVELSTASLEILGQSKAVKPHVIVRSLLKNEKQVYFIDRSGKLTSSVLLETSGNMYTRSYLSAKGTELTILVSEAEKQQVLRMRLSDNLVLLDTEIEIAGNVQLGADVLFVDRESSLGYLQAYNLNDDSLKELKGYNFKYLRGAE